MSEGDWVLTTDGKDAVVYTDEIDLRELFLVLWRGKWLIAGIVVAAVVVTWFGSHHLLTPTYESTATLLIVPPTYQTSIEPEPLALDTYRELALTPALAQQIVDKLGLTNDEGEPIPVLDLLSHMSVRVAAAEAGTTGQPARAGVLHLDVTWHDPGQARDIANAWAEGFMAAATSMRRSEANEVASVILRQFTVTEEALHQAEDELVAFRESAQLALARQTVELLRGRVRDQQSRVLGLEQDLRVKEDRLATLEHQIAVLQDEHGQWVGLRGEGLVEGAQAAPTARRQVIKAAAQYQAAQKALDQFEQAAQIAALERLVEQERQRLTAYREALAELASEEPQLAARVEMLERVRSSLHPKLTMARSIPDTALWLRLGADGETTSELAEIRLQDEEPNPNYQYVERQLIDAGVSRATIPQRVQAYEGLIAESEARLRELDGRLRSLLQERQVLQANLAAAKSVYDALQDQYLQLTQERATLISQIDLLRGELAAAREALEEQEEVLRAAESEVLRLSLQDERLARNVELMAATYRSLAQQVGAARLTELTATGDVRFLSPAVVPSRPSGPRHLLNVAVAAVLAGFVGVLVVFMKNALTPGDVGDAQQPGSGRGAPQETTAQASP